MSPRAGAPFNILPPTSPRRSHLIVYQNALSPKMFYMFFLSFATVIPDSIQSFECQMIAFFNQTRYISLTSVILLTFTYRRLIHFEQLSCAIKILRSGSHRVNFCDAESFVYLKLELRTRFPASNELKSVFIYEKLTSPKLHCLINPLMAKRDNGRF